MKAFVDVKQGLIMVDGGGGVRWVLFLNFKVTRDLWFKLVLGNELYTPHLNEKFLTTKSSWDFESDLDTIKPNWVCPENRFSN